MLKKIKNLPLFLLIFSLLVLSAKADDADVRKSILVKFQQLLELKLGQGDESARELAERARDKAGNLQLDLNEMKKLMVKWDPGSKKLFAQLESKEDKLNKIKEEFESLLKQKLDAEDPLALRIAEKGEFNNGKLELTVRQMKELISKWEK
ncbi:MAG: hypothetical protein NE328_18480 [Lentisphaeraceae bacterium]|nr:hypothetical protein [Lentisphaeraceae bacterium]